MSELNLGRVQGAGFYYSTAASGTLIEMATVTPTDVAPLVGDLIIFPNGDLRTVTAVSSLAVTCSAVVGSLKGVQGDQGIQGIQGVQGETGKAATITLGSVGTGEPGTDVVIENTGTSAAAVFNFVIPRGEKGETGEGFRIAKTYSSVAEMNAGYSTDGVPINGFVLIDTGNVEDEENARLYRKGDTAYVFLTDLSGAQGIKGETGATGAAAGFGTPTATVDANIGTPAVTITSSGSNTAKVFNFAFRNLKGETGATGPQGPKGETGDTGAAGADGAPGAAAGFGTPTASVDANVGTPSVTITTSGPSTAKVFNFAFKNLKGETGAQGATPTFTINSKGELVATW